MAGITTHRKTAAPARATSAPAAPSKAIADRWRLTRRLPSAGKLKLFRAAALGDLGPGCYVLKIDAGSPLHDSIGTAFLLREAAVAKEMSHPNLVSLLGSDFNSRMPNVVMPYLEGINLRRLLHSLHGTNKDSAGVLPVGFVLSIARQIASALAALHDAGWLHGQVRPEHVVLSPQGHATLIDLTLARRISSGECALDENFPAAPHYAAPETGSADGPVTGAADIYALGVTLFEACAGRPPFQASSPQRLAICHRRLAPPSLRDFRRDASLELAELLSRMLAKQPLRRPSAGQLERWLAELEIEELRGAGILACR